jgi:hypothetical protein
MKQLLAALLALTCTHALTATAKAGDLQPLEHRGCCSHHQGVCGCEGGRAKCCDGSLSPTCGCD